MSISIVSAISNCLKQPVLVTASYDNSSFVCRKKLETLGTKRISCSFSTAHMAYV